MTDAQVVRVTSQLLKSLMEAHSLGVVHRDIKPGNIFVARKPGEATHVKLLDFGIAKDMATPGQSSTLAGVVQASRGISPSTSASSTGGQPDAQDAPLHGARAAHRRPRRACHRPVRRGPGDERDADRSPRLRRGDGPPAHPRSLAGRAHTVAARGAALEALSDHGSRDRARAREPIWLGEGDAHLPRAGALRRPAERSAQRGAEPADLRSRRLAPHVRDALATERAGAFGGALGDLPVSVRLPAFVDHREPGLSGAATSAASSASRSGQAEEGVLGSRSRSACRRPPRSPSAAPSCSAPQGRARPRRTTTTRRRPRSPRRRRPRSRAVRRPRRRQRSPRRPRRGPASR
ncbi:MAG: hypothetical protein IPG04_37585 [Polyangiaceae bacterium]|nr:hypothetical protein [Polyangiaceae bacterium]